MGRPKGYIAGVAFNDADYNVDECPFYSRWRNMISRCYGSKKPAWYQDCSVCDEWLIFSNFKTWMEQQDWQGKELDKDLLKSGNKIYSPDNCCFITDSLNTFITDCRAKKSSLPAGVKFEKRTGKYTAQTRDPFSGKAVHIGTFSSAIEAKVARDEQKRIFACQLANEQKDFMIAEALRARYA